MRRFISCSRPVKCEASSSKTNIRERKAIEETKKRSTISQRRKEKRTYKQKEWNTINNATTSRRRKKEKEKKDTASKSSEEGNNNTKRVDPYIYIYTKKGFRGKYFYVYILQPGRPALLL